MSESYEVLKSYLLSLKIGELQGDEYKHFILGLHAMLKTGDLTNKQFSNLLMTYIKQTSNIDVPLGKE